MGQSFSVKVVHCFNLQHWKYYRLSEKYISTSPPISREFDTHEFSKFSLWSFIEEESYTKFWTVWITDRQVGFVITKSLIFRDIGRVMTPAAIHIPTPNSTPEGFHRNIHQPTAQPAKTVATGNRSKFTWRGADKLWKESISPIQDWSILSCSKWWVFINKLWKNKFLIPIHKIFYILWFFSF